ncbi:hypothetical protein A3768_0629 [Ralstonia solanacearum]|nr:hypothetical protein A3768_0629 [Ralstonia solanacearum]
MADRLFRGLRFDIVACFARQLKYRFGILPHFQGRLPDTRLGE